ncbi:RhuM family protein [Gluconobacter japonicus]|uniref:RhuM family protein n=1 Tax=Gluconobacter TaxID=441 RepID=UPI001B8AC132|nr:RhuM family protein [Gluconobacter cerinus]MBS1044535.1 virulence RhuM family protein [Gluconobacter cerinus]
MRRDSGRVEDNSQDELVLAQYKTSECEIDFGLSGNGETIWATQAQIAEAFDVTTATINHHLKNVFEEGELDEKSVIRKYLITAKDGKNYNTLHYNLDAILSVGYRVSGPRATKFRQWANRTLRAYLEQGYVLNERVLRESPEKLNELAAKVRSLRSEEAQVYAKVRECFKISASDYDGSSQAARSFFSLIQDKFHFAVTNMTASKIRMDRADHTLPNMGLVSFSGKTPTRKEAEIGKNYLSEKEIYRIHILSEQFLLFAETTALAQKRMTMESLRRQLDRLLELNDYPVFDGYRDFLKQESLEHTAEQFALYQIRLRVEATGLTYDPDLYSIGEYDDILED